ncbi:hypothetical protein BSG1_21240 [Bacillus sp. SG-1]|nr:hypothetical protein BSG1_21240 [Bacillus sp. SG-1]
MVPSRLMAFAEVGVDSSAGKLTDEPL